ncbi:hypothetical protein [Nakamurella deserti]|uniref:hypothetical protein n=1 Tax=Nakamurella deserti TaxID=2164074 RepID=UPI000DBE725F|nr:hypothetical protein [Nakamurella deserti]
MRTASIVTVFAGLTVVLVLLGIMIVRWKRYRAETDRLKAWQAVYGPRGGKVALVVGFLALAVVTGALAAFQARP